jgi:hypothetical protein
MIDIASIQRALVRAGHLPEPAATGALDEPTIDAVDKAIAARGVDGEGWLIPRRLLAWQQLMLVDAGLEPGVPDGLVGPGTLFAMEGWHARLRDIDQPEPDFGLEGPPPAPGLPGSGFEDARIGQARSAPDPRFRWPRQAEAAEFYGPAKAIDASLVTVALPYPMRLAWDLDQAVTEIRLHALVAESAVRALTTVATLYTQAELKKHGLDRFGGSFTRRKMRGGRRWSMRAFGAAISIDPLRNALHDDHSKAYLARPECGPFLDAFAAEGWVSVGRDYDFCWEQLQAARL